MSLVHVYYCSINYLYRVVVFLAKLLLVIRHQDAHLVAGRFQCESDASQFALWHRL